MYTLTIGSFFFSLKLDSVQFFILGQIYPKYWILFFSMQFVDIFAILAKLILSNYNFYLIFYKTLNEKTQEYHLEDIKDEIYKQVGLIKHAKNVTTSSAPILTKQKIFDWSFFYSEFVYLVWITSDLFYWIIYFAAFTPGQYFSRERVNKFSLSESPSEHSHFKCTIDSFRFSIFNFFFMIDEYEQFLEAKLSSLRVFHLMKKILNFRFMFRMLCVICLIGAALKFFFNFKDLIFCMTELVLIEDFFKRSVYI